MEAFLIGVAASLLAGFGLWLAIHRIETGAFFVKRRHRTQLAGTWFSYHVSRDSKAARKPMWTSHIDEIEITRLGRVRGSSRAEYGAKMTYRLSGVLQDSALRVFLDNEDAHEGQASCLYPNLLGGDVLVGILVGEDFDRQWFASPSVKSRRRLSDTDLNEFAKGLRINRAA